jgi:hypothetical protein
MKRVCAFLLPVSFSLISPLLSSPTAMADIVPHGFVDSAHSVQTQDDYNLLNSKTRARIELDVQGDSSELALSANAIYNSVIESQTGVVLHEAYGAYFREYWDIRVGRQLIVWGKADGIRIVDLLCPTDYTEFIALEFDDVRIPVNALRFRILANTFNIELVGIPVFAPGVLPPEDSPFKISTGGMESSGMTLKEPVLPDKDIAAIEGAARVSFFLPHMDLAFSALSLWDDFPVLETKQVAQQVTIQQQHHRFVAVGAEFSAPVHEFVFRGEAATYFNRHFQREDLDGTAKANMLSYILGIDWYPGDNWTFSVQGSGSHIWEHPDILASPKNTAVGTVMVEKKFLRETLTISNMTYMGLIEWDVFNRISGEYALNDAFHLYAGFDLFAGDKQGTYGRYNNLSSTWFKAKYSF